MPTVPGTAVSSDLATPSQGDLICFSHLRWNFVTQRPQHLMRRAALQQRVFFLEEPTWHAEGELPDREDGSQGMYLEITSGGTNIFVVEPHISWGIDFEDGQRTLLQELIAEYKIRVQTAWYYTPMAYNFSRDTKAVVTVYDCMDELSAFRGAPADLVERERELISAADVVFTGGISLAEAKQHQHANLHAFPSSIDAAHFAEAKTGRLQDPEDQAGLLHPRAGFYGVVDERFDLDLFREVAASRPTVQFVVLGPVVKIDPETLPQAENIHYLGGKDYSELPAYLSGWDAALLPFARNESTEFISPTKTPEYLAAGKTVVSTDICDVVRGYGEEGLVAIAPDAATFAAAIDAALQPQKAGWAAAVAEKLSKSSWDQTWTEMQREIRKVAQRKPPAPVKFVAPGKLVDTVKVPLQLRVNGVVPRHRDRVDTLVVGAGFAGSVMAERIAARLGEKVLVIDQRDHIAGNAYDELDEAGVLVHRYGPHIFHTNSEEVVAYLSRFTEWRPYEHRVLASVDGKYLPIPINLDTVNGLYGLNLDAEGMKKFLEERAVAVPFVKTSEDLVISRVGRDLYEKFFQNYTRKQWGLDPSELDSSVAGRIPVRFDRDDRYFSDTFQAMPREGYTRMFERILDHRNITVRTGTSFAEVRRLYPDARVVYTGPIDEYFDFCYGPLPYRSLEFKHETHDQEQYQQAAVLNYPNDHEYTRVTEFKYLTGQQHSKTSIVYEYPRSSGDPYYPIPRPENARIYAQYRELAERTKNVHFVGRLANYKYFNMDQVVAQALRSFRDLSARHEVNLPKVAIPVQLAAAAE